MGAFTLSPNVGLSISFRYLCRYGSITPTYTSACRRFLPSEPPLSLRPMCAQAIAVLAQLPNVGAVETAALEALRATHFYASAAGDLSGPQACVELLLLLVCKLGERFGSSLPLPKARPHSPGQTLTCAELRSRSSLPARIPGLRFTRQPLSLRSPWHACLAEPLIYRLCNASAGYRHIYR